MTRWSFSTSKLLVTHLPSRGELWVFQTLQAWQRREFPWRRPRTGRDPAGCFSLGLGLLPFSPRRAGESGKPAFVSNAASAAGADPEVCAFLRAYSGCGGRSQTQDEAEQDLQALHGCAETKQGGCWGRYIPDTSRRENDMPICLPKPDNDHDHKVLTISWPFEHVIGYTRGATTSPLMARTLGFTIFELKKLKLRSRKSRKWETVTVVCYVLYPQHLRSALDPWLQNAFFVSAGYKTKKKHWMRARTWENGTSRMINEALLPDNAPGQVGRFSD